MISPTSVRAINQYVFYTSNDSTVTTCQKALSAAARVLSFGIVDLLCQGYRDYHAIPDLVATRNANTSVPHSEIQEAAKKTHTLAATIYFYVANPALASAQTIYSPGVTTQNTLDSLPKIFSPFNNYPYVTKQTLDNFCQFAEISNITNLDWKFLIDKPISPNLLLSLLADIDPADMPEITPLLHTLLRKPQTERFIRFECNAYSHLVHNNTIGLSEDQKTSFNAFIENYLHQKQKTIPYKQQLQMQILYKKNATPISDVAFLQAALDKAEKCPSLNIDELSKA